MIARRLQIAMLIAAAVALLAMGVQAYLASDDPQAVAALAPTSSSTPTADEPTTTTRSPNVVEVSGLAGGASGGAPAAPSTTALPAQPGLGQPLDPSWPKSLWVLSDSVVLSGKNALPGRFPGWQVTIDGKPALMVKKAIDGLKGRTEPVGSVAVVALGYNSLWEKNRRNYDRWAQKFDEEAEALIARLRELGAKKIVWVTVRELNPDIVPAKALKELPLYSWYFPYVNERLRALVERHPEVALADWSAASQQNGLTYDSIHLNETGAQLMSDVIAKAVGA